MKNAFQATPVPGDSAEGAGTPASRSTPSRMVDASPLPPPSSQPSQPSQPVPLPPLPEGAVNPSGEPRIVRASDAPGGGLPLSSIFTKKEEPQPAPPAPVEQQETADQMMVASTPAVDRVVASVDGDPITMREVKDFASQHGQPIDTDDFASSDTAKTAVKALIGEKLLDQEVKKYDDKDDDSQVDKYIAQLRIDKHMIEAEFRARRKGQ